MRGLKQLLAATDFSSSSLEAVNRGFQIASASGAHLTVLHALGLDALAPLRGLLGGDISVMSRQIADEMRGALAEIVADPARNRGVTASLQLEPGMAAAAVPRCADAIAADLILVGAHGKGFLQRFLLGSTASRLLRRSVRPVLVVKEACRAPYRRVLVPVDFSIASATAVRLAREVAQGAEIVLAHVFEVPFEGKLKHAGVSEEIIQRYRSEGREEALRRLHDLAGTAGLAVADYTTRVVLGDATRQIVLLEEEYDCDLVVMGKHGTNAAEELLLGSVTSHILAESRSDVLVVVDHRAPDVVGMSSAAPAPLRAA